MTCLQIPNMKPPLEHFLAVQDWDQLSDSSRTGSIIQSGTEEMTRHKGHMAHMGHLYMGTLVNGKSRSYMAHIGASLHGYSCEW